MKKYEFTGETINHNGVILRRIKALRSFGTVDEGEVGGFIENDENLSHVGDCWIADDAKVYGNAKVKGNAYVDDESEIYDNAIVEGFATVYGESKVFDYAKVYGWASLRCYAKVYGKSEVYGNARVSETSEVFENAIVCGCAEIKYRSKVHGNSLVHGTAYVYYEVSGNEDISKKKIVKHSVYYHLDCLWILDKKHEFQFIFKSKEEAVEYALSKLKQNFEDEYNNTSKSYSNKLKKTHNYTLIVLELQLKAYLEGTPIYRDEDDDEYIDYTIEYDDDEFIFHSRGEFTLELEITDLSLPDDIEDYESGFNIL